MNDDESLLQNMRRLMASANFNQWLGFHVEEAVPGRVVISMPWRQEVAQYAGFLHAGVIGALLDTGCGAAAATVAGPRVLAAHYAVNCLRPAVGETFKVIARVVKPGKTTVFTAAELFATQRGEEKLVATGEAILNVLSAERA